MGLLSNRRISRAVDYAYEALDREEDAPFAVFDQLDDEEKLPAYLKLAEQLIDDEALDHARLTLEAALALRPDSWDALGLLVQAERGDPERRPQAIAALRRLLQADPGNAEVTADLAQLLIEAEKPQEALDLVRSTDEKAHPVLALRAGEALVALGRPEEALAALHEVRDLYQYRLKHAMLQGDPYEMREHMMEAARLYQELHAELHGGPPPSLESLEEDATDADISAADVGEGDDFEMRGHALMKDSPRLAEVVALRTPAEAITAAKARLAEAPKDPVALARLGCGQLRQGTIDAARDNFDAACAADPKSFPGFLGMGAVLNAQRFDLHATVRRLAVPAPDAAEADLTEVFPEWPVLTELERHVVWAAALPLRAALPALRAADAHIRVLPIEARPQDLEAPAAATVRIESLLDVDSPDGWAVARALARVGFPHLPAEEQARLTALFERAQATGWLTDAHSVTTPAGFFALVYADFLRQRHGLSDYRGDVASDLDDELMAFCANLADFDRFPG
jgi:tetratricopeptide (TPR) repeat protein